MQGSSIQCLTTGCVKIRATRGLCHVCYNKLRKKIQGGELSWQEAEDKGLCLAAKPRKGFMRDIFPHSRW